jgi:mRNA interferase YafQ
MRRIEHTNAFRRDFKREKRGPHRRDVEVLVATAASLLANDNPLPERNRDHALAGRMA